MTLYYQTNSSVRLTRLWLLRSGGCSDNFELGWLQKLISCRDVLNDFEIESDFLSFVFPFCLTCQCFSVSIFFTNSFSIQSRNKRTPCAFFCLCFFYYLFFSKIWTVWHQFKSHKESVSFETLHKDWEVHNSFLICEVSHSSPVEGWTNHLHPLKEAAAALRGSGAAINITGLEKVINIHLYRWKCPDNMWAEL